MRWLVLVCVVAAGCAGRDPNISSDMSRARSRPGAEDVAVRAQMLDAFAKDLANHPDSLDQEALATIDRWLATGRSVLTGPYPEAWESVARVEWPAVRSALGPSQALAPWIARFSALLE